MKIEEQDYLEFECPKCGSFMFGSSDCHKEVMIRHCHGNEEWKCDFNFPSTDDWKYFVKKTLARFESKEEYDAFHNKEGSAEAEPCGKDKAPEGWWCRRQKGHEGPCAAEMSST